MFSRAVGPKWNVAIFGVVIVIAMLGMGYPTFRMWLDKPPLVYNNLPFPVEGDVLPGHVIPIVISRCNTGDDPITYVVARSLYRMGKDGDYAFSIAMSELHVEISPGCSTSKSNLHVFPLDLAGEPVQDGTYVLQGTSIVSTPWRTHYVHWKTRPFRVIGHAD